jgi:hypothetical protein
MVFFVDSGRASVVDSGRASAPRACRLGFRKDLNSKHAGDGRPALTAAADRRRFARIVGASPAQSFAGVIYVQGCDPSDLDHVTADVVHRDRPGRGRRIRSRNGARFLERGAAWCNGHGHKRGDRHRDDAADDRGGRVRPHAAAAGRVQGHRDARRLRALRPQRHHRRCAERGRPECHTPGVGHQAGSSGHGRRAAALDCRRSSRSDDSERDLHGWS